jgi:aconitate hydratase
MAQKILAGRCADPSLSGDLVLVKVDQVVLARAPGRALAEAVAAGLKKTNIETAVAYQTRCVTSNADGGEGASLDVGETLARGVLVARPGVGFAGAVHLERFASPARLCVTDEPRLAGVGGAGMLSLVVAPGQLGQALAQGSVWLRPPRSVQVLLSGRVRPFVCARDVALELMRRGLADVVRRVEAQSHGPVVLEFAGPSTRLLSVGERSVLAGLAPQVGAAAALFLSDERTEVFLRDQRRSKAHRALVPDAGAPCEEVVNLDLGAVDPLLQDETGQVRSVRDLAGKPVTQVVLGGDNGVTLRDLFAAATLLKAKRVPPRLDLLLAIPSRQMLETLSSAGALTDLLATGARLVEPDARMMEGVLYPPPRALGGEGLSARTCDPEPRVSGVQPSPFVVASAETLSYAVATGEIGDPRSFKRTVRVTVPRALPTDDVLVVRERRAADAGSKKGATASEPAAPVAPTPWKGAQTLEVVDATAFLAALPATSAANGKGQARVAVVCATLDEVRTLAARLALDARHVGAVIAPFIPSGVVALLSGLGVAAIEIDAAAAKGLREGKPAKSIALPAPAEWSERQATSIGIGGAKLPLTWLALGVERAWAIAGSAAPLPKDTTKPARR